MGEIGEIGEVECEFHQNHCLSFCPFVQEFSTRLGCRREPVAVPTWNRFRATGWMCPATESGGYSLLATSKELRMHQQWASLVLAGHGAGAFHVVTAAVHAPGIDFVGCIAGMCYSKPVAWHLTKYTKSQFWTVLPACASN